MKQLSSILAAAFLIGTIVPAAKADVTVSVDFFHDNLESYGDWREVGDYGYCWQPRDVDGDWRPYSDGRWLYTDAGWTWDSEEPYSWAVYHYGRWARVDRVGWVWVPGTEWGPAWVSWRRSPRYVGWAPLPPNAEFRRSVGFNTRVDADYDIGPTNYSFVEVRNFGAPRLRTVIVEPRENITIITQTTNITRITYTNNVVYNEGPQYDVISRESAQPIRRLKLERREKFDGDPRSARADQLRTKVEGDSLRVVAIPFDSKPATAPRKLAAKVEKVEVNHGWKDAGPPAEVAKLRTQIKSAPAAPAESVPEPKTGMTAETPAESAVSSPAQDEKPAKGKIRKSGHPTELAAPATTEAAPPEEPAAPSNRVKRGKDADGEPEASRVSAPTADDQTESPKQPGSDRIKKSEIARPPAETRPKAQSEVTKRKARNDEPSQNLVPAAEEALRKKSKSRVEDRPRPNQTDSRRVERKESGTAAPNPQAIGPESQQLQPASKKSKGKSKDEKKEGDKPDEAPE